MMFIGNTNQNKNENWLPSSKTLPYIVISLYFKSDIKEVRDNKSNAMSEKIVREVNPTGR